MKFKGIDIGAVKQFGISIGEVRQKGILIWPNVQVPLPAFNLQATSIEFDAVELLWEIGQHHTSNQVQRREGTGSWMNISTSLPANSTTYVDTTVAPSTSYEYRVKSSNTTGSVYSQGVAVSTPSGIADTPPNLRAENITNNSTTILWNTVQDAENYRIRYKKASVTSWITSAAIAHPTSTLDILNLESEVTYQVQVRSENAFGNSAWSTSIEIQTLLGLPSPATNLNFANVAPESLTLNWTNNGGQTSIIVQRKTGTGSWVNITGVLAGTATTFSDSGLTPSTEYAYRIRSSNSAGTVYSSAESVITEQGLPYSPNNFRHTDLTSTSVRVLWDAVDNANEYVVRYKKSTDTSWATGSWATQLFRDFSGLTPDTSYQFSVKSRNSYGESPWSAFIQFSTVESAPTAATGLNFTNVLTNSITVNWTNGLYHTSVQVQRKQGSAGSWVNASSAMSASTTSFVDSGLSPNTEYYYRIKSANTYGIVYSAEIPQTTDQEVVSAIALSSPSKDYKSISLAWTEASGAVGYRLHMTEAGVSKGYIYPEAGEKNHTYTELNYDTQFSFYIEAQDSSGNWYGKSNTLTVSTDTYPTSLAISPAYIALDQASGDFKTELLSNQNWSITEQPSWLTISGASNNGDDIFTVFYDANNSGVERTGYITVTEDISGNSVTMQLVQEEEAASGGGEDTAAETASYAMTETSGAMVDSINGYNGTVVGGVARDGTFYDFSSSGSRVDISDNNDFDLVDSNGAEVPFTLRFRITWNDLTNQYQWIYSKRDGSTGVLNLVVYQNYLQVIAATGSNTSGTSTSHGFPSSELSTGVEYHIVMTFDPDRDTNGNILHTSFKFYVEGAMKTTTKGGYGANQISGFSDIASKVYVGGTPLSTAYGLKGKMRDLLWVKGEAWTAQQVTDDFNSF